MTPLDAPTQARLRQFVDLLLEENRTLNLTAIREPAEVWPLHIEDSLGVLPLLAERQAGALLDLGAGGGVPGIPLACVLPAWRITLLDATRKKLASVERMGRALGLTNVRTLWGRAETVAQDAVQRERFDVVVARAVAPLPVLIELAAGFVRVGGECLFYESVADAEAGVALAAPAAGRCSLVHTATHRYTLGARFGDRAIVAYRKAAPLAANLPRSPGRPQKRPLA
jgi:16S rRNA (guanine527-N7)-methyltransferase